MFEMGQERRIGAARNISALPPRADVGADIVARPLSATSRLFGEMLDDHPRSALRAWSVAIPPVARDPPYCWRVTFS
jgi:hypothetical protein